MRGLRLIVALAGWAASLPPAPAAHAEIGAPVADVELVALEGGRLHVLGDGVVNVLVFFRPGQDRSRSVLKGLAQCQKGLAGKPVRWVAIVSSAVPRGSVQAIVTETGLAMPVLVDEADALYGRLGISLHPVIVVVGADRRLAAFEPFHSINYCPIVTARVRRALDEISEQELQQALSPPRATEGGSGEVARRYRALGAALAARGNCAAAADAFRRVLEIDPRDAAAKEGLERCGR